MSSQPTDTLKPDGQVILGLSSSITRKQNVALAKSLKITAIYFIFGSLWIILTDSMTKNVYGGPSIVFSISVGKGLLYVFLTAALIFSLVYPALKKIVDSEDNLKRVNEELETSNTELRLANEKSEKSEMALLEAQKLAHIGSFEYDRINEILTCTDEVFSICGIKREEFSGTEEAIGQYIHPEDMEYVIKLSEQAISENRAVQFDCRMIKPDGEERTTNVWITPVFDGNGLCIKNVGTIQDITEAKQHLDQIQYMYDHDYPTDLYNRRYFENAKNELDKEENYPLSIVLTDINGVRLINDAFGTDAGDRMIIKTGEILKSCCREGDVLARMGGDDFSILMPSAGMEEANKMLLKIKNACEEFNSSIEDKTQVINLSMGYGVKTSKETRFAQTEKEAEAYLSSRKLLEQKSHHNAVLSSIMATMYERSFETEEHAQRIAKLSRMIGKKMNLSQAKL
ncbi:MAG: diguanylate cyclase domain-containing protein, partial [Ignavibacteriales bacterium]